MTRRRKYSTPFIARALVLISLIALAALPAAGQEKDQPDFRPFPFGETVELQLGGGEKHFYALELKVGESFRLDLMEKGVDCDVAVVTSSGDDVGEVLQVDFGEGFERETITYIPKGGGTHVIVVMAVKGRGSYSLTGAINPASGRAEQQRAQAVQSLTESMQFWHSTGGTGNISGLIQKIEGSLKLWKELKEDYWIGYAANLLGKLYYELGQKQKAIEHLELALGLFGKVGDKGDQALVSSNLGQLYGHFGRHKEALKLLSDSLAIREEMRDEIGKAAILDSIGVEYARVGSTQAAIKHYERALQILKDFKSVPVEAGVLTNIGQLYARTGEVSKASSSLNQALVLAKQTKNVNFQARVLDVIGDFYSQIGEFQRALEYGQQSLRLYQQSGHQTGQATVYSNIGEFYLALGELQEAQTHFQKALAIVKEIGDDRGAADVLSNLAKVYRAGKDVARMSQSLHDAKELLKGKESENPQLYAMLLLQEALILRAGHDDEAIIRVYTKVIEISRAIGYRSYEAMALIALAELSLRRRDIKSGMELYTNAFFAASSYTDPEMEARALTGLMVSWYMLENRQLAIFYGKEAINKYQGLRTHIRQLDREAQKSFLRKNEDVYVGLAFFLLEQGRHAEALQVINASQDQQFYDYNRDTSTPARQIALTPREAAFASTHRRATERIVTLDRQIEELKRRAGEHPSPEEAQELTRLTKQTEIAFEEFSAVLRQAVNDFSRPSQEGEENSRVEDLKEMQATLRELSAATAQKTVAIYTLVTGDGLRVLLITPDSVTAAPVVLDGDFNKNVLQYYALLQSPTYDPRPLGKKLYDSIVKPVEPALRAAGAQTLLWSLGGALRYLPMASLWDGERYLVERYQHVVFTRADRERMTRAVSLNWKGIGFGNSRAQSVDLLGNGNKVPFSALPGVQEELEAIFHTGGKAGGIVKGEILTDDKFTKKSFLEAAKRRYALVHIASHFSFRPGDDTQSFLLLGDGTALTLNEMRKQTRLFDGVELLTLSACETAATRSDAMGREIDGFAELAQRLGASAVLATLWQVSDNSTRDLMVRFYELYGSGKMSKAEALRQAQLALLTGKIREARESEKKDQKTGRAELAGQADSGRNLLPFVTDAEKPFAHPYFWSPFILIGNWR